MCEAISEVGPPGDDRRVVVSKKLVHGWHARDCNAGKHLNLPMQYQPSEEPMRGQDVLPPKFNVTNIPRCIGKVTLEMNTVVQINSGGDRSTKNDDKSVLDPFRA